MCYFEVIAVIQQYADIQPSFQICTFLQGASAHMLEDQKVPYAVKQNQWVGYDNKESFETKVVV